LLEEFAVARKFTRKQAKHAKIEQHGKHCKLAYVFILVDLVLLSVIWGLVMAENGGFEPPIELSPYNGLANRRLQPLGQLSVCVAVSIPYRRCPAVAIIA
jgi:hypothetical protein